MFEKRPEVVRMGFFEAFEEKERAHRAEERVRQLQKEFLQEQAEEYLR